MKITRPQFTVLGLMLVVACTALLLSVGGCTARLERRAQHFAERARFHALREAQLRAVYRSAPADPEPWNIEASARRDAMSALAKRAIYHASLKAKYEGASRSPWSEPAPDPPEPE